MDRVSAGEYFATHFIIKVESMGSIDRKSEFSKISLFLNSALTIVHTALLIVFFALHVPVMGIFNIFSVTFYLFCYILIYKRKVSTYILLVISEITIHLILATICCGWECGFPLYTFAMLIVIFYERYLYFNIPHMKKLPWTFGGLSMVIYLSLKIYSSKNIPFYPLGLNIQNNMYVANSILVFSLIFIVLYHYTINALMKEQSLQEIADCDELTKLYNRHKMNHILKEMDYKAHTSGKSYSVAMLDIDDFKKINDTYGHDAGDYVLKTIAQIMSSVVQEKGKAKVSRWGGEEFLVAQSFTIVNQEAINLVSPLPSTISRILQKVRAMDFNYNGRHLEITMTAGVAHHMPNEEIGATIKTADNLLYWGKQNGKNRLVTKMTAPGETDIL
ncbi:MAG TPA: hypothetical protein DCM57_05655 [Treponema sp.]|jgi:diguanylate cyclase (GGDEF)-like protein|nr:hypothetical protein [Treponema sp.]